MKKIKVEQNCMKWRENWSKTNFEIFVGPPPQKNLDPKFFLSSEKIKVVQNCLKWREHYFIHSVYPCVSRLLCPGLGNPYELA